MSEPTVGDLLAAADRDARRLLAHAEPQDGPGLAAGYAGVLHAAYDVLAAIPTPAVGAPPAHAYGDYLSVRLTQMITQVDSLPPAVAAPHPGMTRIADTFQQAATLIRRHAEPSLAYDPQAREDAAAARVRVARTLAAAAHVTARELAGYTGQVKRSDRPGRRIPARPLPLPMAARWVRTTQRHEQLTLDYLEGRLSRPADERGGDHLSVGRDLSSQLASWSTLAQRRAADPAVSSTDLHHIAATQNVILNAAGALAGAALVGGELTAGSGPHLMNRLDAAATDWAAAATAWTWAQTPDRPGADPRLISESAALMGVIDRATRTGSSAWASPDQVAERLNHLPAAPILIMITESADALAETYQHLPQELTAADRIRVSATTLLAFAAGDHSAASGPTAASPRVSPTAGPPSLTSLPVSMSDVVHHRTLPLNADAQRRLNSGGAQLATTAQRAHHAVLAATLSPPYGPTLSHTSTPPPPPRPQPGRHQTCQPTPGRGVTP